MPTAKKIKNKGKIVPVKKVTKESVTANEKALKNNTGRGINLKENFNEKIGKRPVRLYRKIAYSFILLTIILIAIVFYFSFVRLTIVLIPNQERLVNNLVFNVYDKSLSVREKDNTVSGIVTKIEVVEEKTFSASGAEPIGEEVTGKVTIINNYNKNQPLVATTRLLSPDNKLFRIKETINVPAQGKVEVAVYADEPEPVMAIGPTKFTIPGLWLGLQDKIYAESKEKFIYQEQAKKFINQVDLDKAASDLRKSLVKKAELEVSDIFKEYDKVLFEIDENSIKTEVGGKIGEEKDNFKVSMKTNVVAVAFSTDKIFQVANDKLNSVVPSNKELVAFDKDKIIYSLNDYNLDHKSATISISFEGQMVLTENAEILDRQKLTGLTRVQIEDYLDDFPEIAGYEVSFFPSFLEKAPSLVDRIEIKVESN